MNDVATSPLRTAFTFGPHAGAHRVAARAGVSVFVPLLILVLIDRTEWAPYAAFGAFTSLYGRRSGYAERTGMQAMAGLFLTGSVVLGTAIALLPGSVWWTVPGAALVAITGQVVSTAFRWHPPGSIFLVFGITVSASLPGRAELVPISAAAAALSALFAMLVGRVGALREPTTRPRAAVPAADLSGALRDPVQRIALLRLLIGILVAGTISTSVGGSHPSWAMVAVVATLTGPRRQTQIVRGVHRVVGTLAGVLVAWPLLAAHPSPIVIVVLIMVLQVAAELLVGRNYAIALLAITPLALLMGQLSAPRGVGTVLTDRAAETALGAIIALVLLVPWPRLVRHRRAESVGSDRSG
ncbi:FUSC family protein [Flexivirga sp. B27]